jgi:hypothetical protein
MLLYPPGLGIAAEIVHAVVVGAPAAVEVVADDVVGDVTVAAEVVVATEVTVAGMAEAEVGTRVVCVNFKGCDESRGLFLFLTI